MRSDMLAPAFYAACAATMLVRNCLSPSANGLVCGAVTSWCAGAIFAFAVTRLKEVRHRQ